VQQPVPAIAVQETGQENISEQERHVVETISAFTSNLNHTNGGNLSEETQNNLENELLKTIMDSGLLY